MIDFTADLRARLQARLSAHERREHALEGRRHAAVAAVLVDSDAERHDGDPLRAESIDMSVVPGDLSAAERRRLDGRMIGVAGGAAFLLCRRASRLTRHAGQWALPGGRIDDGEAPLDAVLRELDEELRLRLGPDSALPPAAPLTFEFECSSYRVPAGKSGSFSCSPRLRQLSGTAPTS